MSAKTKKKSSIKMDGKSYLPQADFLAFLKSHYPEAFSEGKIDPQKLKLSFGEIVNDSNERYGLSWAGKSDCFRHIQEPTTATLKPVRKESVDFDKTENIFIEGDNLQVLKVLQKSYYGKIKMIYIDPPYNTGNDSFIYPDRFQETEKEYLQRIGDKDEEGNLMRDGMFQKNSRDTGHFHSNWLSMMYPRLFLAKNLLRDDGVIFVSIDDNEVHNLRMVMNEIFGEGNFIDSIIWKKRYGGGAKEKYLISVHEYILMYAKNKDELEPLFVPQDEDSIKRYYKLRDEKYESRGPYRTHPLEATKSMGERKNLVYEIPTPDGGKVLPKRQWLWSKDRALKALVNNALEFIKTKNGWTVHTKQYLKDEEGSVRESKMFSLIDNVFTQHGTNEIIDIFGDAQVFPFSKPTNLIKQLINVATKSKEHHIVLDFFAGSCSTADAVSSLNLEDDGDRKYIMVQLPETFDLVSFKTISDVGKERLRIIRNRSKKNTSVDLGLKVLRLDESNFKVWQSGYSSTKELENQMKMFVDNVQKGSSREDILYELILKSGRDLNATVEEKSWKKKKYFSVDSGQLIVILEDSLTRDFIDHIIEEQPQKVICLDSAFAGNDQLKTNTHLQLESAKIDFKVV